MNTFEIGMIVRWHGFYGTIIKIEDKMLIRWFPETMKGETWFTLDGKLFPNDEKSFIHKTWML